MAVAKAALFDQGKVVNTVLDMAGSLEPVAGKFAVTLFFFGTLSAGLSSVFPCMMIAPLLLADYQSGELDSNSKQFRIITGVASLAALIVPVFGANPIEVQILSQVFNVFVLPVVIVAIFILLNSNVMKAYPVSKWVNAGLITAFVFSCLISVNGVIALFEYF
jgi:manganese transport protein